VYKRQMTGTAAADPARWNQTLMDYGARVCTSRPKCHACVVSKHCATYTTTQTDPLPLWARAARSARGEGRLVADEETTYGQTPRTNSQRPAPRFEHTPRYFRGRIIDALRDLPPSKTILIEDLPALIANERTPTNDEVETWVSALERSGLIERRGNRLRLPA
jgi:A/G-specific adenine glycosylase